MRTQTIPQLDTAAIGRPITREGVSLFPLYLPGRSVIDIAPNSGDLEITEKGSAQVPSIEVRNPGTRPVLLVEGETITGGQQDRVLNVSVLVPARGHVEVPVSCVEADRWDGPMHFDRGRTFATRRVRRAKSISVADSILSSESKLSDQPMVWDAVDRELRRLEVDSPTRSLRDGDVVLDDRRMRLPREWEGDTRNRDLSIAAEKMTRRGPLPGQCGVVIAHGFRVVTAEIFASAELLAANWSALVRAAFLDAPTESVRSTSVDQALRFVSQMATAPRVESPGVGLGNESHLRTPQLVGQSLILGHNLVHACAFTLGA